MLVLRSPPLLLPFRFTPSNFCVDFVAGDVRMGVAENPNKVRNLVATQLSAYQALYEPYISSHQLQRSTPDPTQFTVVLPVCFFYYLFDAQLPCLSCVQQNTSAEVLTAHFRALPYALRRAIASYASASLAFDCEQYSNRTAGTSAVCSDSALWPALVERLNSATSAHHHSPPSANSAAAPSLTVRNPSLAAAARRQLVLSGVGSLVRASSRSQLWKGALSAGPTKSLRYAAAKIVKLLRAK
jgi:hypothetical protein